MNTLTAPSTPAATPTETGPSTCPTCGPKPPREIDPAVKARQSAICLSDVNVEAYAIVQNAIDLTARLRAFVNERDHPDAALLILRAAGCPIPADPHAYCGPWIFADFVTSVIGITWALDQFVCIAQADLPPSPTLCEAIDLEEAAA